MVSETKTTPEIVTAPQTLADLLRNYYRRIMRHGLVLAFTGGVFILFVIETDLPLWLALLGFMVVGASTLIYVGPPAAIDPNRWRAERRYAMRRDAADLIPNPILLLGMDGKVRLANKAVRNLFQREDLRGLHISSIVRDPIVLDALKQSQQDGNEYQVEWHIPVPIERYFNVTIAAALVPRRGMRPFLLVNFDEQTEARHANQMRSDFIANASHELKTPLAIISGYLETIKTLDQQDHETREKFIGIMEEQATRMVQLIEELLSLSQIERLEHKVPNQIVNLAMIIREAVNINQSAAARARVEIQLGAMDETINILGDEKPLIQTISNLINNALTHGAGSSAKIEITISKEQLEGRNAWGVHVKDFGRGIAPYHIPRLTERFYRINPEESRRLGGTGLGLAIVKHILTRHHGELKIASREGEGAVFTALLMALPD